MRSTQDRRTGELVRIFCRGCRATTTHVLERDARPVVDPNEVLAGCVAHCLRCGKRAVDNYWLGRVG